jgi:hypothetical protein
MHPSGAMGTGSGIKLEVFPEKSLIRVSPGKRNSLCSRIFRGLMTMLGFVAHVFPVFSPHFRQYHAERGSQRTRPTASESGRLETFSLTAIFLFHIAVCPDPGLHLGAVRRVLLRPTFPNCPGPDFGFRVTEPLIRRRSDFRRKTKLDAGRSAPAARPN